MKKLFLLGAMVCALIIITACHKDNDTQQPNDKRLCQIVEVSYSNNGYFTSGYAYRLPIVWNDSVITKWGSVTIRNNGDTIFFNNDRMAIKENGRIVHIVNIDPESMHDTWDYTYNEIGQPISAIHMCTHCVESTITFSWENGNLIHSHEEWYGSEMPNTKYEVDTYYEYDNKNTPWNGMEDYLLIRQPKNPPTKNNAVSSTTIRTHYGVDFQIDTRDTSYSIQSHFDYKNEYPVCVYNTIKTYYVYMDGTSANIPQFCTITADANRYTEAGYKAQGSGTYEYGATVILQAFERDFICWDDGNTDNPRTVIARGDATYTAIYTDK